MQTIAQNKNALSDDALCPKCTGPAREVHAGWFCPTDGLIDDQSKYLRPSPDPISQALRNNPERREAWARVEAAQVAYNLASDQYFTVLSELHAVRVKAQHDQGEWVNSGWRPSRSIKVLRKREAELVGDLEREAEKRDAASAALSKMRRRYQQVSAEVSTRLGRPVPLNDPNPTLTIPIV